MTSALAEKPAVLNLPSLIGEQRPRILWVPEHRSSAGVEAVELAASAGLQLDPWQQWLLEVGLAEDDMGRWLAFEVVELLSRQNGKGSVLEAVVLGGLYLFGDPFIGWSAHEFKTCREGFLRVQGLIEGSDDLRRRVRKVTTSHGEEGIELHGEGRSRVTGGQRLRFMARSTGAGRGFTGRRLVLDEAQHLPDTALDAVLPTMSAQPNPQVWYAATAPNKDVAPCQVLARLRKRALCRNDPNLVYAEWSIDPHITDCPRDCGQHDNPGDVRSWAKANPALGIRISVEHVAREFAAMSPEGFARERLGVGNWPVDETDGWQVISEADWRALTDPASQIVGPVAFAADVTPLGAFGSIAAAGRRADGRLHVEITIGDDGADHRPGTGWMVDRLVELAERHPCCGVAVDATGPSNALIKPLEAAGFDIVAPGADPPPGGKALVKTNAQEMAQACGQLLAAVTDTRTLVHLDQPELAVALAGAQQRPLGDGGWAWSRKTTAVAISPLVAATLAAWLHGARAHLMAAPIPEPFAIYGD